MPLRTLVEHLLDKDWEGQGQDDGIEDEPWQKEDTSVGAQTLQCQKVSAQGQGREKQDGNAWKRKWYIYNTAQIEEVDPIFGWWITLVL